MSQKGYMDMMEQKNMKPQVTNLTSKKIKYLLNEGKDVLRAEIIGKIITRQQQIVTSVIFKHTGMYYVLAVMNYMRPTQTNLEKMEYANHIQIMWDEFEKIAIISLGTK